MKHSVQIHEVDERDAERLALVGSATFLETFAGVLGGSAIIKHCELDVGGTLYDDTIHARVLTS